MVSARFRAGKTSARLTWMGRATGPAGPAGLAIRVAAIPMEPPGSGGHDLTGQVIQGWSILGSAGVLRYPSTSLLRATPAPHPVIQPSTAADLPNGQGPCLRNSSPAPARLPVRDYFLLSHCSRKFRHSPICSPKQHSGENGSGRGRKGGRRPPIPAREERHQPWTRR